MQSESCAALRQLSDSQLFEEQCEQSNENYSDKESSNSEDWQANKTQSSVIYINPDFAHSQEILEKVISQREEGELTPQSSSELLSPKSPALFTTLEKDIQTVSDDEDDSKTNISEEKKLPKETEQPKERKEKHSRTPEKKKNRSRSRSPRRKQKRSRRSRSSSRDTFDGIFFTEPSHETIRCNNCNRLFASVHDTAVHEIRTHDTRIPCAICAKVLLSPAKLVNHTEKYHASEKVRCRFCEQRFGGKAEELSHSQWNDFREHIFREMLRRKIKDYENNKPETTALRGVGRCPHGPAVKCRNFPKCPGSRCIYSHGRCDFSDSCSNNDCPFDHPNRPRICMSCVKDLKTRRRTRSPPSRSRN